MISIVIPTLNEVKNLKYTIGHTLAMASEPNKLEILVVDSGSTDRTLESISDLKIPSFVNPSFAMKKYKSLNFGFEKSTQEIVLFLDADTHLPKHFDKHIIERLKKEETVGGAFDLTFHEPDWKLSLLMIGNNIRYRLDNVFYGDQAIFVRRSALNKIGGVPRKPLMEAAYLCKELRQIGRLTLMKPGVKTSSRRFHEYGFFNVAWFDINMFIRFNLGLSVDQYAEKYWSKNLRT